MTIVNNSVQTCYGVDDSDNRIDEYDNVEEYNIVDDSVDEYGIVDGSVEDYDNVDNSSNS